MLLMWLQSAHTPKTVGHDFSTLQMNLLPPKASASFWARVFSLFLGAVALRHVRCCKALQELRG